MEISVLSLLLALNSGVHALDVLPFQGWFQPVPDKVQGPSPDVIIHYDQTPNATRSGSFKPFKNSWPELSSDSVLRDSEWTWRVNVSQFYAPYNRDDAPGPSNRQAFVSQTYDFTWSADGNLSEALDGATGPLCITQLGRYLDLPVNVTNSLLDDDTSCASALGQDCVKAILDNSPSPSEERGCGLAFGGKFDQIPECKGSLGRHRGSLDATTTGFSLGNKTAQIDSGDTFWVNVSGPVLGNETWLYNNMANQIQVLLLSVLLPTNSSPGTANVSGTELLCIRANNTELPEIDADDDGVASVGEVVLLSAGTTIAGVGGLTYLGLVALAVAVVLGSN
ncbi:hypothetical protein F4808DRAFT_467107 [Astrocystis sublimbata]|nr:hypothetical protein F4808DRAFT_467107 [Astrocystis sublimbata]